MRVVVRIRWMGLALLLLSLPGGPAGCDAPREAAASRAAAETEVRRAIDAFFDAARRSDWDAAGAMMADDFEIYADGAAGYGKAEYVRVLKADDLRLDSMALSDVRIQVARGGDMAWASYRGWFRTVTAGVASTVETAETQVFRDEPGGWKLVRAHASVKRLTGEPDGE